MTDFAKPTTPAEVLRAFAKNLRVQAQQARSQAALQASVADTLESAAYEAEDDADRYERYQPKPTDGAESGKVEDAD